VITNDGRIVLSTKEIALLYAYKFIGTFYSWGGDDPSGFDCSGFIVEILKSVAILKRKTDYTAQGLWDKFKDKQVEKPYAGCLVFWGNDRAIHIEMCINKDLSIGACGGGSRTITKQDAINHNAFIKVRPWNTRFNIKGFADPF